MQAIGSNIGINSVLNGSTSVFTLTFYYVAWSCMSTISGWFNLLATYIWVWVTPRIVQSFYINDKRNPVLTSKIYSILAYIADTNPNSFNKDYAPAKIDGDRESNISPGTYIIMYNSWYVVLNLTRASSSGVFADDAGNTIISMWTLSLDRGFFDALLSESQKMLQMSRSIYVYGSSNGIGYIGTESPVPWTRRGPIDARKWSNTIITAENLDLLRGAIERFQSRPQKEIDMEIPHKLCIMLSGPPGFGKTTTIKSIAHEYQMNLYAASLGDMSANDLNTISRGVRPNSILVFEDIDCMVNDREPVAKVEPKITSQRDMINAMYGMRQKPGVPLSSFLNMLDGLTTSSEYIVIMTTNYPERLDGALARSERVNLHLKLGPDPELYSRVYRRFFPEAVEISADTINEFAEVCTEQRLSLADLQAHFRKNIMNHVEALKIIKREIPKSVASDDNISTAIKPTDDSFTAATSMILIESE